MVGGRVGAGGRFVLVATAALELGCLTRQHVDETTGDAGTAGTTDAGTTASSTGMDPQIMTTTESPGTTEAPSCSDGQHNQDESDVDCGGVCTGCELGEDCDADDDCASQACAAGVCVAPSCLDDDDCAAQSGACTQSTCGPDFVCTQAPAHEGEPCDDGAACSTASACTLGTCTATATVDCSMFDTACTLGTCDPDSGGCFAADAPEGSPCEDGNGCTIASTCTGGSCVTDEADAAFFEDFSGPAAGWTKDGLWAIGPAVASPQGSGGADPASDHSPGDDNRLAGAGIGKLDTMASHASWCLTSPILDTSDVGPGLWVTFWRHLHAPAEPPVTHTIDVWNGANWSTLESGYDVVSNDAGWTFMKINATGHQAAEFRVRICWARANGAENFAGWSVDDVTVAAIACTP